ncbi:enzymatic polyprotein [Achlya hypogyna]|uniref:Enzymatic polyprotein n=1 Tax=Achlya hypogyna TaxID=1202772 RepID=A0A1V9YHY2_ACHHY|nr:enzymatic polyprotein [Achlya hypogyna]
MVRDGLARQVTTSEWSHPAFIRPKKANPDPTNPGHWRLVNDLREINKRTEVAANPLPRITDLLDRVAPSRYFTLLDLASSFWQVRYADQVGRKFTFTTEDGCFEPTGMLMAAVNSAGAMQEFMTDTFKGYVGNFVEVYIDDVMVHSTSMIEHQLHVRKALERVRAAGWTLRREKCVWGATKVEYLGHSLEGNGVVSSKQALVKEIITAPEPETTEELREFLGRASYYRRFIPGFATAAGPLFAKANKRGPFALSDEDRVCIRRVTELVNTMVKLQVPDPEKPYRITVGSDFTAIGCVLAVLNDHELRYTAVEKTMLALMLAVRGVLPSSVHADRMRSYLEDTSERDLPHDDVDTSGVDWDKTLEPLLTREEPVRNRRPNWNAVEVLRYKRLRKPDRLGRPQHKWYVRCDDSQKRWARADEIAAKPLHHVGQLRCTQLTSMLLVRELGRSRFCCLCTDFQGRKTP